MIIECMEVLPHRPLPDVTFITMTASYVLCDKPTAHNLPQIFYAQCKDRPFPSYLSSSRELDVGSIKTDQMSLGV
jgi:hypothetical protein